MIELVNELKDYLLEEDRFLKHYLKPLLRMNVLLKQKKININLRNLFCNKCTKVIKNPYWDNKIKKYRSSCCNKVLKQLLNN